LWPETYHRVYENYVCALVSGPDPGFDCSIRVSLHVQNFVFLGR